MISRPFHLAALVLAMIATPIIGAQEYVGGLQPVEQGVTDTSPLATSLRVMQSGLATPLGFENVYAVPGRPDKLMRISGGLYVVFSQSTYVNTPYGASPTIPPDAEFFIGPPPALYRMPEPAAARAASPYRISGQSRGTAIRAIPHRDGPLAPPRSQFVTYPGDEHRDSVPVARGGGPAIVSDDAYRAERLKELLQQAAAGDHGDS